MVDLQFDLFITITARRWHYARVASRTPGMESILARASIGMREFKVNPMAAIEQAEDPVAILNRNKPVACLVPASEWEAICERLEDVELAEIVRSRADDEIASVEQEGTAPPHPTGTQRFLNPPNHQARRVQPAPITLTTFTLRVSGTSAYESTLSCGRLRRRKRESIGRSACCTSITGARPSAC